MSITLQKLCLEAEKQYGMKLVAGERGLQHKVRWVYTVEDREVPDFLHGSELVFTTGIGHVGMDPLLNFVKRLQKHGAAGLVVNIGPYVGEIPQTVMDYCNQTDFALFTLPWSVYIIDITYDFCRRIIEQEKQEKSVENSAAAMLDHPENAAESMDYLKYHGFGSNSSYMVVFLKFYKEGVNVTESVGERMHQDLSLLLTSESLVPQLLMLYHNGILVIRQNPDRDHVESGLVQVENLCRMQGISIAAGISTEGGLEKLSALYQEAHTAQKAAKRSGSSVMAYEHLGLYKILLGVRDQGLLTDFADSVLEKILSYDKRFRTHYAEFLEAYIQYDGSVNAVAESFGCHRNTVNTKIKAIKETFGLELNAEEKVELLLAFQIHNLYTTTANAEAG